MPSMLENVIVSVVPDPEAMSVSITWANGATTTHTMRPVAGKGVFAAFRDPAFFSRVRVGDHGRSLDWPGELDFCADALWFEANPGDAPGRTDVVDNRAA